MLFRSGLGQTAQALVANASVGGAYDTGALVAREGNQTGFESTAYGFLSAGTSYSLNLRRISFGASAATAGQYIPGTFSPYVPNHSVALYSSMPLSKRTRISAAETLSIQPYTALALALQTVEQGPVQAPLLEPMLGITRDRHLTESRSVALGHELGRRSSVSLSYARYQSRTSRGADDLTTQYLSARFTRTFWKGIGLYVGYSVTQAQIGRAHV